MQGDDWEGMYYDGNLLVEGPSLTPADILASIGIRAEVVNCDPLWLARERSLPLKLGDVQF